MKSSQNTIIFERCTETCVDVSIRSLTLFNIRSSSYFHLRCSACQSRALEMIDRWNHCPLVEVQCFDSFMQFLYKQQTNKQSKRSMFLNRCDSEKIWNLGFNNNSIDNLNQSFFVYKHYPWSSLINLPCVFEMRRHVVQDHFDGYWLCMCVCVCFELFSTTVTRQNITIDVLTLSHLVPIYKSISHILHSQMMLI